MTNIPTDFEPEEWLENLHLGTINTPYTHPRNPDFAEDIAVRAKHLRDEHDLAKRDPLDVADGRKLPTEPDHICGSTPSTDTPS